MFLQTMDPSIANANKAEDCRCRGARNGMFVSSNLTREALSSSNVGTVLELLAASALPACTIF